MAASPLLQFGLPAGIWAWSALGLACLCAFAPLPAALVRQRRLCVFVLAGAAALLSFAYFRDYLGGAPRVIDAAAYLLEGRLLAGGEFSFIVPEPSGLFRGRFLIHPPDAPLRVGVIFPPGYPLLLAAFERVADYRWVGPLLAAALVYSTAQLAFLISKRWPTALLAAAFSVLSVCLRYHTADTMSHGLSALLATLLVLISLLWVSRPRPTLWLALAFGGAAGWLVCTRQLTGLVWTGVCFAFVLVASRRQLTAPHDDSAGGSSWNWLSLLGWAALGAVPGVALLLAHHHALTGEFWSSPQLRYYALSDGPADCFRLGFGAGCRFEHAEVVRQQGGGLSLFWALRNTLHRLHAHSLDVANLEPLVLVALWWAVRQRRTAAGALFLAVFAALPLAYALFYFNGSFWGGGARFLVELLPFEHAALALGLAELGRARLGLVASLLGFALHGSFSHADLRDNMEGSPNAELLERAGKTPGGASPALVFVESDHAFLSLFQPRAWARVPAGGGARAGMGPTGTVIAHRGDPWREQALWDVLGRPPAFRLPRRATRGLEPWAPTGVGTSSPDSPTPLAFEAESEWPVLEQRGLWSHPAYPPGSCVSRGRSLLLHPNVPRTSEATVTLDLGAVPPGNYQVTAVFWTAETECFAVRLADHRLPAWVSVPLPERPVGPVHLDRLELSPR